jgi:two-component system chemotaxis response regulator CheY
MALNFLIVDDSAVMRAMLLRALRGSGLPIAAAYEAGTGNEALDQLACHEVDVAMIDINMPGMNGIELLDHIRANPALAHLTLVVVSTEGSEVRIGALADKGVRFVHKPFAPEQVRTTVLEALGVADA